jgi:hypothetical protein
MAFGSRSSVELSHFAVCPSPTAVDFAVRPSIIGGAARYGQSSHRIDTLQTEFRGHKLPDAHQSNLAIACSPSLASTFQRSLALVDVCPGDSVVMQKSMPKDPVEPEI